MKSGRKARFSCLFTLFTFIFLLCFFAWFSYGLASGSSPIALSGGQSFRKHYGFALKCEAILALRSRISCEMTLVSLLSHFCRACWDWDHLSDWTKPRSSTRHPPSSPSRTSWSHVPHSGAAPPPSSAASAGGCQAPTIGATIARACRHCL